MALAFLTGYTPSPKTSFNRSSKMRSSESEAGTLRFVDLGAQVYWEISVVFELLTETEKDTLIDWLETNETTEIALTVSAKTYNGYINPQQRISGSPVSPIHWEVSFGFKGVKQ